MGADLARTDQAGRRGRHSRADPGWTASSRRPSRSGRGLGPGRRAEPSERDRACRSLRPRRAAEPPAEGDAPEAKAPGTARAWSRRPPPAGGRRRGAAARAPTAFWVILGVGIAVLAVFYGILTGSGSKYSRCCWLVLSAGRADPRGARLDRVRARDADRGGGGGLVRRIRAGGRLRAVRASEGTRPTADGVGPAVDPDRHFDRVVPAPELRSARIGPPMWVGWVTIVAAAAWCVHATSSCG